MISTSIARQHVPETLRIQHTASLFGIHFPLNLEPSVYSLTRSMSPEYHGGYWEFYTLSNSGFYMAPHSEQLYSVSCENGYEGTLSADALGITACLYAYSHLSFSSNEAFAEICANHYHWLREYMLQHADAAKILGAID